MSMKLRIKWLSEVDMSSTQSSRTYAVRQYVQRVASQDQEDFPRWDLTAGLPKLPVPKLTDTLDKYLLTIQAVLPRDQYEKTRDLVEKFGKKGGVGEKLQELLLKYTENQECWAYGMWFEDMYMKNPLALPINSNPGMLFPRHLSHFYDRKDQLKFATKLISGILDYKTVIDTRSLPIDRANTREKGQPLCMEQYYRLFPSYREPGDPQDRLTQPGGARDGQHVVVACKNQFFCLDVVMGGARLSDDNIYSQLRRIMEMAEENQHSCPRVGILTAGDRRQWAHCRDRLRQNNQNRLSLEKLERCIFVLCLDEAVPVSFNHQCSLDETQNNMRDEVSLAGQMLHGSGSRINSCNRWFDKTMQFIIGADGACGLCYEHSASEGIAVVQLIEHLLKYMDELRRRKLSRMQSISDLPRPVKLQWSVPDDVTAEIETTSQGLDRLIEDLDLFVLRFEEFGKNFPKSQNMSPDAFIQLALQLTYYKIHQKLVPTYESASIRRFRQGRVDNIRANTPEALEWCKAMVRETESTAEEQMDLLRVAIKRQTEIMVDAILGQGIDNHLVGLREMARLARLEMPEVFTDETFTLSWQFTLSTSQVPTSMDAFMCYGPVVPNGYGCCYNPHPDNIVVVVTSFKADESTQADFFAATLDSSFRQMRELCLKVMGAASAMGAIIKENGHPAKVNGVQTSPCNSHDSH